MGLRKFCFAHEDEDEKKRRDEDEDKKMDNEDEIQIAKAGLIVGYLYNAVEISDPTNDFLLPAVAR